MTDKFCISGWRKNRRKNWTTVISWEYARSLLEKFGWREKSFLRKSSRGKQRSVWIASGKKKIFKLQRTFNKSKFKTRNEELKELQDENSVLMEENEILREKAQKVNELESLIARDFY